MIVSPVDSCSISKKINCFGYRYGFLESAKNIAKEPFIYHISKLNLCEEPSKTKYTSAYLLDVLEHIPPKRRCISNEFKIISYERFENNYCMPSLNLRNMLHLPQKRTCKLSNQITTKNS